MNFSLDSYRMMARQCAFAHRTQSRDTAKAFFAELWERLDRETLDDHCDARMAFNAEFARAYRSGWQPGQTDAPAPQTILDTLDTARAILGGRKPSGSYRQGAPAPARSVAADCAAFYAKQTA